MSKRKVGDCTIEITPATKKWFATWLVTRGERQIDGVENDTTTARRAAREAAVRLGCRLRRR